MDWSLHDHRRQAPSAAAPLAPITVFWRVAGPSGKPLTCALYAAPAGRVEVRVEYSALDLLRSEVVRTRGAGADLAAVWKLAVLEKGFRELDTPGMALP